MSCNKYCLIVSCQIIDSADASPSNMSGLHDGPSWKGKWKSYVLVLSYLLLCYINSRQSYGVVLNAQDVIPIFLCDSQFKPAVEINRWGCILDFPLPSHLIQLSQSQCYWRVLGHTQVLLSVGCAETISSGRCPGGILSRCPSHFILPLDVEEHWL